MRAYKLLKKRKDGSLGSLFINARARIPVGEWLVAGCHPTKGYALRPGWHCTLKPVAPHLSKKGRVWCEVEVKDCESFERPRSQGGKWLLAKRMKVLGINQNPSSRVSASPQRRARMRNPIEVCFCMSPGGTPLSAGAMTRQAIQRMWKGWLLKPQSAQAEVWIVKKSRKKIISNVRFGIGIQMPSFPNPIRTFYIREIPDASPAVIRQLYGFPGPPSTS